MGHNLSKALGKDKGTSSKENKCTWGGRQYNLITIRDFISLWLTYPVKLTEEETGILKAVATSKWETQPSLQDFEVLTEKATRCIARLLPMEIISKLCSCNTGSSIFASNDVIPEVILDLTVDLAVEQLIQTLFSGDDYACNIRYVKLSTRNLLEKRSVIIKIEMALEDKHSRFGMDKDFRDVLWIDASACRSNLQVQEEINKKMAGLVTEHDDMLLARHVEEEMINRYLVVLVDRDGDRKQDPSKVHFPAGIVVLITDEQLADVDVGDEFLTTNTRRLNIRTQDHLLPWEVFCSYVGSSMVRSSRAIQRIAVQIVKECRGHLLAIVLVAKSLKNVKDVKQWELALSKLHYTNPSYDYLERDRMSISRVMVNAFVNIIWEGINKTQKLCLELSLFVPKIKSGVPGEALISNWVNSELKHTQEAAQHLFAFDSAEIEFEYTRDKAEHNIKELLDCSVLLQCESGNVHLPVETYAIVESLHSSNPSILRHGALGLTVPPHIGHWRDLLRIELMDNKICELPQSPDCPKLKVLLLQGNVDLMDIPDTFFNHMPLLRYLDLSHTSIRDLPPSIFKLMELKKFQLRGCDLFMELPPKIGLLKNLEELDLDGTLITHLPEEIRELINLQRLTLYFERNLHEPSHRKEGKKISNSAIIPAGVISELTQLNYLCIEVDPEDERWKENVNSILLEIFGLEKLEAASIHVPEAELLELIPVHKSINFRLVVGHHMQRFISRVMPEVEEKFKRCVSSIKFVNGVNVPNGLKMNLERFRALYLDRHMTMKSLSELLLKNLDMLQVCILAECSEMETVADMNYLHDKFALPNLEFLSVFYLKNLRSICKGTLPMSSVFLSSLKSLTLHTCPMLTTIFTSSFIGNLSLLEELIVEDCSRLTTLISHDSFEHETHMLLPRLKVISLLYLPELVSIFNGFPVGQGLEKMGFYYCPKLLSLSKAELSSKSLEVIKGESKWWEGLKWNEAEWEEDAYQLNFLNLIFSPIDEEADILTQLVAQNDKDQVVCCPKGENIHFEHSDSSVYQGGYGATFQRQNQATKRRNDDRKLPSNPEEVEDLRCASTACPLNAFTFDELKLITANFRPYSLLGEGGFGRVYKGFISKRLRRGLPALAVAVKVHDGDNSHQGHREWLAEVKFWGQLSHPNLVKLIGYCCEDEHRVLIYEYMSRGGLEDNLFSRNACLSWSIRMKIAFGAAKALAFLHHEAGRHIYRNFKTSKILLDQDFNAKLDFGCAKDGPVGDKSHVSTRVMGTYGYVAPEYIATGHLTVTSDVYSFGVVLLELLTGRRCIDRSRPTHLQNLREWALPLLKEKRKFVRVIDPKLDGNYPVEGARKAAKIAYGCLNVDPEARPLMRDIVPLLERLQVDDKEYVEKH
ncbi:hypothetical protein RJT34_03608 [Clitoria ternatea]|uniref:non-specific serine/threonine protein kinase n=1 Tax=Clitoria ternatea TaxID=43366 RepID=A0AAN9KL29_CLITE